MSSAGLVYFLSSGFETARTLGGGQGVDDINGTGKEHRVALEARRIAKRSGQVRFAQADAAQIDEVGLVFDKPEAEVVLHLEAVNLGGPVPAKLIQGFDDGKACLANAIFGGAVAPQVRLAFDESGQVVHMGPLLCVPPVWPSRHSAAR